MDEVANPFSPGAGSRPPELAGREEVLHQAQVLLARTKLRRPEKCMLLIGLRGVGKTVLLNAMNSEALKRGYQTVSIEGREDQSLARAISPHLRTILLTMDGYARAGEKAKRAFSALRNFISTFSVNVGDMSISLDAPPAPGIADSGDLEIDLQALLIAVGEAALERQNPVAIIIDEMQYFSRQELAAILVAMHKIQQLELPLTLLGAGLPTLPGMAGDAKSYAERLLSFPEIGPLSQVDTAKALQEPAKAANVSFDPAALAEIYRVTQGYPYFVQEWGSEAWKQAPSSPISLEVIHDSTRQVIVRLDRNFFRVRYDRLPSGEKRFLRAMAEAKSLPTRTGDVADLFGVKVNTLGPVRSKLIQKGMIYSPAHGELAFTVPLFGDFMKRVLPELKP